MRRYLLGFLGTFLALMALNALLIFIAFSNWFMQDTPLWFTILYTVLSLLLTLAGGQLTGQRPGRPPLSRPLRGFCILEGCAAAVAALYGLFYLIQPPWAEIMQLLVLPPGGSLLAPLTFLSIHHKVPLDLLLVLGTLCLPPVFHLGWHWGRQGRS